jgi:sodium/potassium-transporting ATPase subunit alpha
MKGAPERVMARCWTQLDADGVGERRFDERARRAVESGAYAELAARGERVLGFAQCWLSRADFPVGFVFDADAVEPNFPTDRLCFVGLVSLADPPRDAVPDAVAKCRAAFIRVVMVTGDHPATASAIARQVGIISAHSVTANDLAEQCGGVSLLEAAARREARAIIVHGELLRDMSDDDLDLVLWHDEIVFARTSPQQKLRIVEVLYKSLYIISDQRKIR